MAGEEDGDGVGGLQALGQATALAQLQITAPVVLPDLPLFCQLATRL